MSRYEQVLSNTLNIDKIHKVVVSLSGGLDSTTLLYLMTKKFGKENVYALSFDYSQKHDIELIQAKRTCKKLDINHTLIDISFLGKLTKGVSAMVKGGITTPTMNDVEDQKNVSTYVPFRNMILSSITFAFAETMGADGIALGVQYGDYALMDGKGNSIGNRIYHYWDTSNDFTNAIQAVANLNDKHSISFIAPFINLTKKDEIRLGVDLDVDYSLTNTCYNPIKDKVKQVKTSEPAGGHSFRTIQHYQPCGVCPSCSGRAEAFAALNLIDPVVQNGIWED